MRKITSFLFFYFFFGSLYAQILPGRLGQDKIFCATFGDCDIYFYMNQEKLALTQDLKTKLNEEMVITFGIAALPCPTREVMAQAVKNPDKDPKGTAILAEYAKNVHRIIESEFGIDMTKLTWYVNLNLNWEALKIHHDQFIKEYQFLKDNKLKPKDYTLVHDLTLVDWEMGKSTVAGTLVQDGRAGDRYILCVFPNEAVGTFYAEPAYQLSLSVSDNYPGQITMPPHSTIAPMDLDGRYSCGSAKGKRLSTIVRGLAPRDQMNKLREQSELIPINKRTPKIFQYGPGAQYPNGIIIQPLSDKFNGVQTANAKMIGERDNITYSKLSVPENAFIVQHIAQTFEIPIEGTQVEIIRLTKKDEGFSHFQLLGLEIDRNTRLVLTNSSHVPTGYRYFNLAEDATKKGCPWIQLYELSPGNAMEIPIEELDFISLSPCEELIYRNESADALNDKYSELLPKIASHINVFIFHVAPLKSLAENFS